MAKHKYVSKAKRILDLPGRIRRPSPPPVIERVEHVVTDAVGRRAHCECILGEDHGQGRDA